MKSLQIIKFEFCCLYLLTGFVIVEMKIFVEHSARSSQSVRPPETSNYEKLLQSVVEDIYESLRSNSEGNVSTHLSELTKVDPNLFGMSAVTLDGTSLEIGDSQSCFTAQSIAKLLILAVALEHEGADTILNKIGIEPTGERFDAILHSEDFESHKLNPFINAGALATLHLIPGKNGDDRFDKVSQLLNQILQKNIVPDKKALALRRQNDHRNRALGYLLLSQGIIDESVESLLDTYHRICSLSLNCNDLAMIAAILANGGIHPITGQHILSLAHVKFILSVMQTCGMYEFSGQWAYRVGLPAKSGLCGAILVVAPKQFGFAVYSPPLDEANQKSVRGLKACEKLSPILDLHMFRKTSCKKISREKNASPHSDINKLLNHVYNNSKRTNTGYIYNSAPDIFKIDPDALAIAITTTDGLTYKAGDHHATFLLQSISKVFAYGLALEDHGREALLESIGVEPSGNPYDAIIRLDQQTKRPHNPMINTGAIATTSLIKGTGMTQRLDRILSMYSNYVGHELFVDMRTYLAEMNSGDRNKAIAYLLRHFDMLENDVDDALNLYLQQCSTMVNCQDLSVMAATLANGGVNPLTGQQAVRKDYVGDILTVMYTCGMYDYTGEWSYRIGLPAKSGVSGAIIAVVPGQMGIAIYSPRIDNRGNSIVGIRALETISSELELNIFS